MAIFSLIVFAVCCLFATAYEKSYDGYELIEVILRNDHDRQVIDVLSQTDPLLDFWYDGRDSQHIFVPPEKLLDVKNYLNVNNIEHRVMNDHVQQDIEEEQSRLKTKKVFDINDFNSYDDIAAELVNLATRCRSDLGVTCDVFSAGASPQNRELWTFKLSREGSGRRAVWIDATIHAREWLATATHLKILTHMVDDYPNDPDVKRLVDSYDWYFMPLVNPDGYDYTWTSERLWRKNRTPNAGSSCIGTDLNRNFNQMWGNAGASTAPCSETYRGASAASEIETQILQNQALLLSPVTSIHLHTYGQLWLIPWGSYAADGRTCNFAEDEAEMLIVANAAADAVQNTYGTTWARGNSCTYLYPASGLTMDYFKDVGGVKYTVLPELRGNSFVVTKAQIEPSFNEVWNGLVAHMNALP